MWLFKYYFIGYLFTEGSRVYKSIYTVLYIYGSRFMNKNIPLNPAAHVSVSFFILFPTFEYSF